MDLRWNNGYGSQPIEDGGGVPLDASILAF